MTTSRVNFDLYKTTSQFGALTEMMNTSLLGVPREQACPSYDSFRQLIPRDAERISLVLQEATSMPQSQWLVVVDRQDDGVLGVVSWELGWFLTEESRRVGDDVFEALYYIYEDFPRHILQYAPDFPDTQGYLYEKSADGGRPKLLYSGSIVEARQQLAIEQGGVLWSGGVMNGEDPARPWTIREESNPLYSAIGFPVGKRQFEDRRGEGLEL